MYYSYCYTRSGSSRGVESVRSLEELATHDDGPQLLDTHLREKRSCGVCGVADEEQGEASVATHRT